MATRSLTIEGASAARAAGALRLGALDELQATCDAGSWRVRSDLAQELACYLACHPRVRAVRYPGLRWDPDFDRAACTLRGGFGPRVAVLLDDPAAPEGRWAVLEVGEGAVPDDLDGCVAALEAALA